MKLSKDQVQIIRESTLDETAFQRVLSLFEDEDQAEVQAIPSANNRLFNLDVEQSQLLLHLLDSIPVSIYVKDLQSRFIMANKYEMNVMGIMGIEDQSEVIGKTDYDLTSYEEAQYHFELEQDLMRTGIPIENLEVTINETGRNARWLLITKSAIYDAQGQIVGLIGINRDITKQKLAEQSLENQRNLLQTVIDHIQDKIYVKDTQCRFMLANTATLRAQSFTSGKDEVLGTTDFDYMNAERAQQLYDEEQEIMKTGKPIISQELFTPVEVTKTHPKWFLVSKFPIYDESGTIRGLVGINHDITTLKVAEQGRIDLEVEKEKSKITSNFIENASHEFRTPISIIQTCAYLIQKNPDPEKQSTYLERIKLQTERMSKLIDGLLLTLRLDRKSNLTMIKTDYEQLLKIIVATFREKIGDKNLNLHFVINYQHVQGMGNLELLDIAVSNILDNALRYTPDEGDITIRSYLKDHEIVIEIQDTGSGISKDVIPDIFTRFYRGDEAHSTSGIGLGLSVAKQIIELHGGRIEVESQLGIGTLFRILLPSSPG